MWNPANQGSILFSTLNPPNSKVPDNLQYCQTIPTAPCSSTTTDINLSARSGHPGGVNVGLADGSVHFVSDTVDPLTWTHLGTRSEGDPLGDW